MNIGVVMQARMGSSRLPGKVMKQVQNKPLLHYAVYRSKKSTLLHSVIVATSTNLKDEPIAEWCQLNSVQSFRGSEEDVLDRYYQTAAKYKLDIVVRVTSDCPFVDPAIIDLLIKTKIDGGYDYVSNRITRRTWPHGLDVEVFSMSALRTAWEKRTEKIEREHVTPFIMKHTDLFSIFEYRLESDLSEYRLTVDYEEDFLLTKKLIEEYNADKLGWKDIIKVLSDNPSLMKLNSSVSSISIL